MERGYAKVPATSGNPAGQGNCPDCVKQVVDALTAFVERASKENATADELNALPAVAEVLRRYFSSGMLDIAS